MESTQTLAQLKSVVAMFIGSDVTMTPSTVLRSDLGLNSYELVQLICAVEDKFGVEIPDRQISQMRTVQDVIEYLGAHD